ncbi:MAG: GDSL-type esterase/lipase family protein [Myxococcota bacterium]
MGRRLLIAGGVVVGLAGLALLGGWLWLLWYGHASQDPTFFEDAIAAFEAADRATPPPARPVVFVGSSSIRLWSTLETDFAPLPVLNRGFGGSQLAHVNHFLERTVLRYRPRAVLLYAGDNDLDARTGKTADDVLRDFEAFVARVHGAVPDARIYYLAIKPSRLRWERWPEMKRANDAIAAVCERDPRLAFLDTAAPMLATGEPPAARLFLLDGLHLSAEGYALWTGVIRPRLLADLGRDGR